MKQPLALGGVHPETKKRKPSLSPYVERAEAIHTKGLKMEVIAFVLLVVAETLIGLLEVMGDGIMTLLVRAFSHKERRQQEPTQE